MSVDRNAMLVKLQALAARYDELLHAMADPRILQDQERFQKAAREQSALEETVTAFREFQRVSKEADEAASMAPKRHGCEPVSTRWKQSCGTS